MPRADVVGWSSVWVWRGPLLQPFLFIAGTSYFLCFSLRNVELVSVVVVVCFFKLFQNRMTNLFASPGEAESFKAESSLLVSGKGPADA